MQRRDIIKEAMAVHGQAVEDQVQATGARTLLNGHETRGVWSIAQEGRVQAFLKDLSQGQIAFDVMLPRNAVEAPFSLKNGSGCTWIERNWTTVVRRVEFDGLANPSCWVALCVLTQLK